MHRQRLTRTLACLAVVGLLAAGCGDDDDGGDEASDDTEADTEDTAAADDADLAAYCEAEVAIETAPEPEIDFETATPEEISAGLQTYASETLAPLAEEVEAAAPEEVADEVEVLSGAVDEMASTGDDAVFETPEVTEAETSLHQYDLDNCDWNSIEVTATDYAFDGIPTELPTGVTSFELTNDGEEIHELVMARKNDGVTQSAEELLALPEEEALALVTPTGGQAFAAPGEGDYVVVDLEEPGDYIAVCFVPVGMTSQDAPPPEGPPHALEGMYSEFTVS